MTKKLVSVVLVIITVFSTLSITTASAASYKTGTYTISTTKGLNVRSGAGTAYSKVGTAAYNTTFNVSKISGVWGYTSSIKCTNGTKSGWVSLEYCKYKSSGGNSYRATYNDVFASVYGSGYSLSKARSTQAKTFSVGTYVYVWAYVHDANDNLYKSYSSGTCNMKLSIYRPNGTCKYSYTYNSCDNNWIGCSLNEVGTWKIESKITGSISGTNVQEIKVTNTKNYTLTYNANGGSNAPKSYSTRANAYFYLSSSKPTRSGYTFLGWHTDKYATSAAYQPGLYVCITGDVTLYAIWKKNNTTVNPTGIAINCSTYTMTKGSTKQLSATVYPTNASNKSVYWYSSNSSVVSVSSSGKLTANKAGTATITAKTSNGKSTNCIITVKEPARVEISADPFYACPTVGDVFYLSAKAYNTSSSKIYWSTSNSSIVSITSSGKMTAKKAGTATITAKTSDGTYKSVSVKVYSANTYKKRSFDGGYITVNLNKNAGDGKIKIYTYDKLGWKTNAEIHVTLKDMYGKWICEFDTKSGTTLNLGDDHGTYRVYVKPKTLSSTAKNWENMGKCVNWAVDCTSKTYIY